jgi:DNA-binding CsgD family transcriptional regulator
MRPFSNPEINSGSGPLETVGIVVVGSGPLYTRQFCAHIQNEFDVGCIRLDSIDQIVPHAEHLGDLRLIIVDQRRRDDLLDRPEIYRSVNPDAVIALAYRKVEVARGCYDRSSTRVHGRIGYIPMSSPFEVTLSAIRLLLHREYYLPSGFLAGAAESPAMQDRPPAPVPEGAPGAAAAGPLARLTDRESEVLARVAEGQSNKEIAEALGISDHTVKLHMHNMSRKLGVSNRTAAASLFLAQANQAKSGAD